MRAGVIGLGDMGSGLAKNLIANGFTTSGFDLSEARMQAFAGMGGQDCADARVVGRQSDAVFVMVMNGDQAKSVINDLMDTMQAGGCILLTATIKPREAREIGATLDGSGLHLIDSPVSGGFPGAQGGTLTMMAAASDTILDEFAPVMQAVSANIHRVGTDTGRGADRKSLSAIPDRRPIRRDFRSRRPCGQGRNTRAGHSGRVFNLFCRLRNCEQCP